MMMWVGYANECGKKYSWRILNYCIYTWVGRLRKTTKKKKKSVRKFSFQLKFIVPSKYESDAILHNITEGLNLHLRILKRSEWISLQNLNCFLIWPSFLCVESMQYVDEVCCRIVYFSAIHILNGHHTWRC